MRRWPYTAASSFDSWRRRTTACSLARRTAANTEICRKPPLRGRPKERLRDTAKENRRRNLGRKAEGQAQVKKKVPLSRTRSCLVLARLHSRCPGASRSWRRRFRNTRRQTVARATWERQVEAE
ncbi:hypothetical protein TGRUB_357630 [Toxoplasma gondii RUB]|uniref:Uncharacterized protein n=1 Tax=Toxoplasma gondii RUB TaxID=935652 RepID=A0A086M218_TOXGO|nr:hypothetical protein TGRUB_357630 [Toxoplasma gondii RUB]